MKGQGLEPYRDRDGQGVDSSIQFNDLAANVTAVRLGTGQMIQQNRQRSMPLGKALSMKTEAIKLRRTHPHIPIRF